MDNKLELLLKRINIDSDKYIYFNGGKLIKIVGNKEKTIEYNGFNNPIRTVNNYGVETKYAYTDKISNQKYVERYEYDNSEKSDEFLSFTAFKYYGIKNGYVLIDRVGGLSDRYINAKKEQFGDTISFDVESTTIFHYVGPQCFKFKCHIKVEN